jgi:uncharacterized damage-inducible protein DinB
MKDYLIGFFQFNNRANRKILETISNLPEKNEPIRLFSHLVICQHKWLNRITKEVPDSSLAWTGPVYSLEECRTLWELHTGKWITFLKELPEIQLQKDIIYQSSDGGNFSSTIEDIALQLNYHSIHHRAQIMTVIRAQGIAPPVVDFIFLNRKNL